MSINTEKALLGIIIKDCSLFERAINNINNNDFLSPISKEIYQIMCKEYKVTGYFDLTIISGEINPECAPFLYEVVDLGQKTEPFEKYMIKVKDDSLKRRLKNINDEIKNEDGSSVEIQIKLENIINEINSQRIITDEEGIARMLSQVIDELEERSKNELVELPTGFEKWDKSLGGLRKKRVYVIGARPGMGKTALAMSIAKNLVEAGKRVAYFSLELSKAELIERLISMQTKINNQKFEYPKLLTDKDWGLIMGSTKHISGFSLQLYDQINTLSNIELIMQKDKPDVIFIDFIQCLNMDYKDATNLHQKIFYATRDMEQMAKKYDVCIVLLSQLSRDAHKWDVIPEIHHLKESGALEENTHFVAFLHWLYCFDRETNPTTGYEWELEDTKHAEIHIRKNRSGVCGMFKVKYEYTNYSFQNPEEIKLI